MIIGLDGLTGGVIAFCWVILGVVWVVSALFVKRTVERRFGWWLPVLVVVVVVYPVVRRIPGLWQDLWPQTAAIGVLADLVTIAGLAFTLWARAALGSNWSGTITFKEGHELIQSGPYAYVRHPIYSGVLLMALGTAVASSRPGSLVLLGMWFLLLAIKAHFEEQLMTRHFPEAYPEYRRRVKALIPGVW
jgi:protein-S-isoprenylcysteine O-methyltransferase Ste14